MHSTERTLTTIATSLSIVGCVLIFTAHVFWKEIRSNSRKILLYITAADLLTAVGYLIGDRTQAICTVQSFVTTMSSMMSFFWTCCLALYLHAVSVDTNYELGRRIIIAFHCLAWPLPLIITLTALLSDVLGDGQLGKDTGDTAGWCWIKSGRLYTPWIKSCPYSSNSSRADNSSCTRTVLWMLLTGKFWEILSYIIIIIAYVRIWYHVRQQRKQVVNDASTTVTRFRSVERRTILIPLLFVVIRVWGTIRFLLYAADRSVGVIKYLQAFGDGSQGFVNAVMFCLMTEKVTTFFRKCCHERQRGDDSLLADSVQKHGQNYGAAD